MYKVLVLDLDGTLLRSDKTISKRTLNVLLKCQEYGIETIIATARPHRFVKKYLPGFLNKQLKIVYNGAEIYHGKQKIFSNYINKKSVEQIIKSANDYFDNCRIGIESNDVLYANFQVEKLFGNAEYQLVNNNELPIQSSAKVLIDLTNITDYQAFKRQLPKDVKMIITDKKTLGQITNKSVSKLNAIKHILPQTSLSLKDVIAFGDDFNDLDIIKESGVGVAMANAEPALKRVADYITCNNNRDGVATFLEKQLIY